jgi:predicted RNase H-like nuclease (RuvC/YqgF family)
MAADATVADWARVPKNDIIARVMNLENMLAERIRVDSALMAERAELTEKLENTTMMLTVRSTELDRSQKIAAEMSATVAKQRDEIRDCSAEINVGRKNINELKTRLHTSEIQAANLRGQLDRVAATDKHRLTLAGARQECESYAYAAAENAKATSDWVTF